MEFIAPLEISSKIMTLIEQADKELIIVSPYVDVSKWEKMRKCLERAVKRGVKIKFIARKNAKQDLSFLTSINIRPILIDDLHAKFYVNENYGIVTSQNMVHYSDVNSIDIGYITETKDEKKELIHFANNYILKGIENTRISFTKVEKRYYDDKNQFKDRQIQKLLDGLNSKYRNASFTLATSNYIFTGDLFPFADVMFDTYLTIKIDKSTPNCEKIIETIENTDFDLTYKYKVYLLTTHKTHYYIEFVPAERFQDDKLFVDYYAISDSILNIDTKTDLKIEKKFKWWKSN
ncbi:TrmB family transcriptional regulator sugar-binding domain-containing protein [Flavobacterium wongokense]|uniref:TrmB family transcriptional regulator sugar-binding domain-containing protein n=1 Tax=Flavobacterium wongokense TaxID=2910674 RepID=UPI001F25CB31|nr:TrmB family transcriptional regulator sugar-binding domain-containing protein [Flavobacterium sp. WG47]MCF6131107.1 hypothetical protein [Flavobacterium sp. WG47]